MTKDQYREGLDKIYTSLTFQRRELIRELEELNSMKIKFHEDKNNNLAGRDFRKIESKIEITREKINLLVDERKLLKNRMKTDLLVNEKEGIEL